MLYNYRYLEEILLTPPSHFRAVLITGPRRSGKSTLSQHLLNLWGGGSYTSLDTPLEQSRFRADPEGFVRALKTPAVLDEAQNVPELFSYLKKTIDKNPDAGCEYIITGSQQFQMMHRVSESLAGRILLKELLPFSLGEAGRTSPDRIKRNFQNILTRNSTIEIGSAPSIQGDELTQLLARGGFPQAVLSPDAQQRSEWFNSYLETYVQRDIRSLSNIQDLATFSRFVTLVASRTGQIMNYSEIGKDIGVNYKTAQHYISLLETSYLWKSLTPYYKAGSEKRFSKSPKGIFGDTGLAMFLIGLQPLGFDRNPLFGSMFETLVINEFQKLSAAFGERVNLCHFRVGNTQEVDLVLEQGTNVVPIEIKASASATPLWGKGIRAFNEMVNSKHPIGYVVSLAAEVRQLAPNIWNVPLSAFY